MEVTLILLQGPGNMVESIRASQVISIQLNECEDG